MPRASLKGMRAVQASGVLALVIALAACTPIAPEPTPTPTPSATEVKPTPKPTPSISVAPLAIPDCETLLPLDVVAAEFSEYAVFIAETPAGEFTNFLAAPSQATVLAGASPSRACRWGIPNSDGSFGVVAAGISPAQRDALVAELVARGFVESANGAATVLSLGDPNPEGLASAGTTHVFSGDAWIIVEMTNTEASDAVATAVLDSLRTANPALGL